MDIPLWLCNYKIVKNRLIINDFPRHVNIIVMIMSLEERRALFRTPHHRGINDDDYPKTSLCIPK